MEEKQEDKKLGLGDIVEKVIKTVAPNMAKKAKEKGCNCEERKVWLNNIGGRFG